MYYRYPNEVNAMIGVIPTRFQDLYEQNKVLLEFAHGCPCFVRYCSLRMTSSSEIALTRWLSKICRATTSRSLINGSRRE